MGKAKKEKEVVEQPKKVAPEICVVAPGVSFQSRGVTYNAGQKIRANCFVGGQKTFQAKFDLGLIVSK